MNTRFRTAALVLVLVMTIPTPAMAADTFTDDNESVHEADIETLARLGIAKGCTPTLFCPDLDTTRGQMAAFMRRAIAPDADTSLPDAFPDIADSIFRYDINTMAARGIVNGVGVTNQFWPDWALSRIEMVRWMYRAGWCGTQIAKIQVFDDVSLKDPVLGADVPYVYACWSTGQLKGHDGNMFPFEAVSRAQMASFLVRAVVQ